MQMPEEEATETEAKHVGLTKPVFFIGFMGAGKTSVSRRIARRSHIASIDADAYLERREGKKIKSIFDESGEEGFRTLETDVLNELSQKEPLLISCGGGVVLKPENRKILRERGFVVYLMVSADEASCRIKDASSRPLFKTIENARATNDARIPLYHEVADVAIETIGKNVSRIAQEITEILQKEGILCPLPK